MFNNKSIIALTSGSFFTIALSTASISLASHDSAVIPSGNSSFILAQASQQGAEKGHRQGSSGMRDGEARGGGGGDHGGGHGGGGGHGEHGGDHENDNKKSSGMKKGKHDYAQMIIQHTDELKLTDEQLGKITRLHLKHKKTHREVRQALQESMKAFKKGSMDPATNDDQVRKLGKDATVAFNKMVEYHIKERDAVHAILSDDQKKQLSTLKMDHDSHDTDSGEHGGGGHGGH